jgi:hypothetical protein
MSSMIGMPPLVVPPGAFGEEILFRKDRLPADGGDSCLFHVPSDGTITLSVSGQWLVQPMTFDADLEQIDRDLAAAAAQEEAERAARQAAEAADQERTQAAAKAVADAACVRRRRDLQGEISNRHLLEWLGVGAAAFGAIGAGSVTAQVARGDAEAAPGYLAAALFIGGGVALIVPEHTAVKKAVATRDALVCER